MNPPLAWQLVCFDCQQHYDAAAIRYRCECGGTLEVHAAPPPASATTALFDQRLASRAAIDRSGVWRFRERVLPLPETALLTKPEGNTNLYSSSRVSAWTGVQGTLLKHEGENPTGSFKDRGMCVAISMAKYLGQTAVACASTGNTSASMAAYAAAAGLDAFVFIPRGKVATGKLSQALAYGATTLAIDGDFDRAMQLVESIALERGIYLVNSINPYRIEGQKAIGFELLQDLGWQMPDWIVLPGGNLGNSAALYKGLRELRQHGLIGALPRIAVIQASGANPFFTAFARGTALRPLAAAETLATAIRIGNPVSWKKSLRGVLETGGVVEEVSDAEILEAKAIVDRAGIGAEPASCAAVAGIRKLAQQGVIAQNQQVCAILTGHLLKDPDSVVDYHLGRIAGFTPQHANPPIDVPADRDAIVRILAARAQPPIA